ncbi:hypothetical protein MSWHS_3140 [Methanosarcina sp. WWM596]|nr:hypothetical protein MSWHS_3140 [Methanosarcina sp. WWM596]
MDTILLFGFILTFFGIVYLLLKGTGKISDKDTDIQIMNFRLKGSSGIIVVVLGVLLIVLGAGLLPGTNTNNTPDTKFDTPVDINNGNRTPVDVVFKFEDIVPEIEVSDNRLREASPNTVYKSSPYIDVGGENSFRWRDVMGFDLSEYSSDTSIKNAALSLYWYYPAGKTRPEDTIIEVYRPASTWNSDYISWNKKDKDVSWKNPGGDWYDKNGVPQGSTPYATITIEGSNLPDNRYYELDVTDLVKEYTSGKYENTGFLIKARTESNNYIAFYSSDCGNEDQEPKLQLVYS